MKTVNGKGKGMALFGKRTAATALLMAGLALSAAPAEAQFRERAELKPLSGMVLQPGLGLNLQGPLLDPSRMHLSQSVSMGFAGGGGGSVGAGSYLNQLDYRLSPRLDLRLQLGVNSVFHNSAQPGGTGQALTGGVGISWRPSDELTLRLEASRGLPRQGGWPSAWQSPLDGWGMAP
jgi:hypothetical protein